MRVVELLFARLCHIQDKDVIEYIILTNKRWEGNKNTKQIKGRKKESEG
jgi:hypothetical protein